MKQKKFNENESLIEVLTKKLLKGVIDDETYKTQKKIFEKERELIHEEMKNYNENKTAWLEKVEKTFCFAKNAREAFARGTREEKRKIFFSLGSNFLLKDKKLLLNLLPPFEYIQNGIKESRSILTRFEPLKSGLKITKKPLEEALGPVWSYHMDVIAEYI